MTFERWSHIPATHETTSRALLPGLTGRTVVRKFLAGVTLLAIAVPLNIGYAQIAGLPPTAGLCALVLPGALLLAAWTGRSPGTRA